jgi:hypothetical protein
MSRKVKVIKKNLAPAAKPLGVNPMDPWSTKAGITEASEKELLHRFLDSRGINPEFVSRETKIAHSKSGEFMKWRKDHEFSEQTIEEGIFTDDESIAKHLVKKYGKNVRSHDIKLAIHLHPEPHKTSLERVAGHVTRMLGGKPMAEGTIDEGLYVDHEAIAKHLVQRKGKTVNANDIRHASTLHPDAHKISTDLVRRHVLHLLGKGPNPSSVPQHAEELQYESKMSALDKFRRAATERAKKHDDIEREMKARHAAGKEDMKGSIDRLEKHLNKEEVEKLKESPKEGGKRKFSGMYNPAPKGTFAYDQAQKKSGHKVGDSVTVNSKFFGKQKGKVTKVDNQSVHVVRDGKSSAEKYPHDAVVKESAGINKTKETQFHKKLDTLVHNTFGKRKDELKMKEEVEQIDEISKSTLSSYKDKSSVSLKNAQANRDAAEPGKNMSKGFADLHAKSDAIAKKRVKGLIGYMQRKQGLKPMGEDVYQDAQAATQTAFDMGTTPNQTEPTYSRKKEMSKSARIIKSIYKNKKMVKEDMYDHEKEDKSVQTYGKKPKMAATDKKDSFGEEKPDAAAIMSGGTTLTGEKRDNVEIDPMMRNKPGQNVFNKEFGKKGS